MFFDQKIYAVKKNQKKHVYKRNTKLQNKSSTNRFSLYYELLRIHDPTEPRHFLNSWHIQKP